MVKKIIGILGSPLLEGNTAFLLDRALQGARDAGCDVEKIFVANLDFQACNEMMFCKEHETCIMDDDMQLMYQKFRETDGIILATPNYINQVTAALKAVLDRSSHFIHCKRLLGKYICGVVTPGSGAHTDSGTSCRRTAMPPVSVEP